MPTYCNRNILPRQTIRPFFRSYRQAFAFAVVPTVLLLLMGCQAAPIASGIAPFRVGITTAKQQTADSFADVNRFLREREIDRAIALPTLTDASFPAALDPQDVAAWGNAFSMMEAYTGTLQALLDPKVRSGVEERLGDFNVKAQIFSDKQLPIGLGAAFVKLGGLLVQAKSEKDALMVLKTTDPVVQNIFDTMIVTIGPSPMEGVRGTVQTSWRQVMAQMSVQFLVAKEPAAKRGVAERYAKAMNQRDTADASLDALRRSFDALGKAHHDLAQGQSISAFRFLGMVQDEYKAYRESASSLRSQRVSELKEATP